MCGPVEELEAGFVIIIVWSEKAVLCKVDEADGYIRERTKWREIREYF